MMATGLKDQDESCGVVCESMQEARALPKNKLQVTSQPWSGCVGGSHHSAEEKLAA